MERFRFFFLLPRQKQQRAPGGQYGLEQAARQPGGERHNEKQQCQDQNKPGQPEAVVPGGDFCAAWSNLPLYQSSAPSYAGLCRLCAGAKCGTLLPTNHGGTVMLTITLLGTAATMPLPDRALTAALAECGGHALLFDCGEGTQAAARRAGVNLMKLDAICLTHYHGDHIFGLPGLLQTLGCQGRERPLTLYGPEGLGEVWPALRTLAGPLPYPVRAVQLDTDPIDLTNLSSGWPAGGAATPFRTRHRVPSRGYRLDLPRAGRFDPAKARALNVPVPAWKLLQRGQSIPLENGAVVAPADVLGPARRGLRFVFSGDTAPCPALEQAAQNADLFLCDATYPDNEQEAQAKQWGAQHFCAGCGHCKKGRCAPVLADALFAHDP